MANRKLQTTHTPLPPQHYHGLRCVGFFILMSETLVNHTCAISSGGAGMVSR